ncbi:hypothetical protein [Actinocorallia longicatena]|uniref:Uncharacterized protein n=1 Tax=Actinocorallia longicatena TaxID=111803 RepID=A0ABP6QLS2_9ACTN
MIILSGLLVVGAIALLVAGIVTQEQGVLGLTGLQLIYVSIAVSVVSALCLAIGVLIRRRELFGTASARPANKTRQPGRAARQAAAKAPVAPVEEYEPPAQFAETPLAFPMPSAQVPDDAIVHVVPGRKRYHIDTCRQLAGRQTEELTYVEALEEGFSPCTACLPDTALAARAMAAPAGETGEEDEAAAPGDATEEIPPSVTSPDWAQSAPVNEPVAGFTPAPIPDTVHDFPARDWNAPTGSTSPDWDKPATPEWERPAAEETSADWNKTSTDWTPSPYAPGPPDAPEAPEAEAPARSRSPLDDPEFSVPDEPEARHDEDVTETAESPVARGWESPAGETLTDHLWKPEDKPSFVVPNLEQVLAEAIKEEEAEPAPAPAPTVEEVLPQQIIAVPESRPSGTEAEPEPATGGPVVRILSGTKRYHRTDCALIEDIGEEDEDLESLPREEAKARGCTPCLVCQPDKEHAH